MRMTSSAQRGAVAPVRFGLVGYGFGARYFHAPLIASAPECELVAVATRSAERRALVAKPPSTERAQKLSMELPLLRRVRSEQPKERALKCQTHRRKSPPRSNSRLHTRGRW
jgi:hypothetical protein